MYFSIAVWEDESEFSFEDVSSLFEVSSFVEVSSFDLESSTVVVSAGAEEPLFWRTFIVLKPRNNIKHPIAKTRTPLAIPVYFTTLLLRLIRFNISSVKNPMSKKITMNPNA